MPKGEGKGVLPFLGTQKISQQLLPRHYPTVWVACPTPPTFEFLDLPKCPNVSQCRTSSELIHFLDNLFPLVLTLDVKISKLIAEFLQ